MCKCQRFLADKVIKTTHRELVICVCGHSQGEHKITLFKESCKGEDYKTYKDYLPCLLPSWSKKHCITSLWFIPYCLKCRYLKENI